MKSPVAVKAKPPNSQMETARIVKEDKMVAKFGVGLGRAVLITEEV